MTEEEEENTVEVKLYEESDEGCKVRSGTRVRR